MPKFIEMPKLSDTMTEGTLAKWTVKEGDKDVVKTETRDWPFKRSRHHLNGKLWAKHRW